MQYIDGEKLDVLLATPKLLDAINETFASDISMPVRVHHSMPAPPGNEEDNEKSQPSTLLLMPAWETAAFVGVKIVTIFPENSSKGLPSVQGQYYLADGSTGVPLALMDGAVLTARRTAAVSALASRYLSRPQSQTMLMVGCGALALQLIRYHAMVRPLATIWLWGRNYDKTCQLAEQLLGEGLPVQAVENMNTVIGDADIVSAATLTVSPLIQGKLLKHGAHVDLVGAFRPDMREADDDTILRAGKFADTRAGALKEAGEYCIPVMQNIMTADSVLGDLFELASGSVQGRQTAEEITLFKSVGTAAADYATATFAWQSQLSLSEK